MRGSGVIPAIAILGSTLFLAASSEAQPAPAASAAELAAARQLFGEGLAAEDEGRYRDALAAFLRVEKITVSPQVRYHIGLCHEKLGEPVEALNAFELAIADAEVRRALDVLKEARAHADLVRPKIARLVLKVPEGAEGLVITVDGRPVNAALAGTAMLVNPGERKVAVRAENYADAFAVTLTIGSGESRSADVGLGAKRAVAEPPPPPPVPTPAPEPPPAPKRDYVPAYVSIGVTSALALGALATGIAAHVDYSQYLRENVTPPSVPLAERSALRSAGLAKAWASTGLLAGSLAAAGVGVYLLVRPPAERGAKGPAASAAAPRAAISVAPWASSEGGGLVLRGAL